MSTKNLTLASRNNSPRREVNQVATITFGDCGDGSAPVSGDVNQLFSIPAGAIVKSVQLVPITSFNAGTSATISVGDGSSSTRFHNAVDIKSITANVPIDGDTAYRYAGADTLNAVVTYSGGAPTTGEVKVCVEYVDPKSVERYS